MQTISQHNPITGKTSQFEIRHCKQIGNLEQLRDSAKTSDPFKIINLEICSDCKEVKIEGLPYPLVKGELYKIVSWDSNYTVKATKENEFEIIEHYGSDFNLNNDYLLIEPKY